MWEKYTLRKVISCYCGQKWRLKLKQIGHILHIAISKKELQKPTLRRLINNGLTSKRYIYRDNNGY